MREILLTIEPKEVITGMDQDSHTEVAFEVSLTDTDGIEVISEHRSAVNEGVTLRLRMPPDGLLPK